MRLLYAIDIRDRDLWHLDEVAKWALRLQATVDMIYVNPFGEYAPYTLDPALSGALRLGLKAARDADHAVVMQAMEQLPKACRGEILVGAGDPPLAITEASTGYEAVLLSTRANKGLRRLWLGSVAERTLRGLPCAAIVLHGRDEVAS